MVKPLVEQFEKIFIHEDSRHSQLAERARVMFAHDRIVYVSEDPFSERKGALSAREFDASKKNLYLTQFKGSFFKRCPGALGTACCNYFVLNLGIQCNMNCSYCYLQSYINTPVMTIYSNIDQALRELKEFADANPTLNYRVGTGETVDSLSTDDFTLYSHELIAFFRQYPKWTLEFKTKSAKVEQFLDVAHAENVNVTWSINPEEVIAHEEHGTASLSERLHAAELCLQKGFKVGFHIDPIIYHTNWEKNYTELVDELCRRFQPEELIHFTMGAVRFQPEQKQMMRERFGLQSWVTQGEYFLSDGGKMRYDKDLRNHMFQTILKRFEANNPKWVVSLCMETPESWTSSMHATPRKIAEIRELFAPLPYQKSSALRPPSL